MAINILPRRAHPALPSDAPYSPERDLSAVLPAVARQFLPASIEGNRIPAWLRGHIDANKLTLADLQRGIEALQASIDAMGDYGVKNMEEAMRINGFWDLEDAVKVATLAFLSLGVLAYHDATARFAFQGARAPQIVVASGALKDAIHAGYEAQRRDPWYARALRSRKGR